MTTSTIPLQRTSIDAGKIARAGALVALLDGSFVVVVYVLIQHRTTAFRIFQGVASSLLGAAAFDGGGPTAAIGLGIHTCVAFAWATVWVLLLSRSAVLRRFVSTNAGVIAAGVIYGVVVWLAMNQVIVPLTQAKAAALGSTSFWIQLAWHPFGVGIPIVAVNRTTRQF